MNTHTEKRTAKDPAAYVARLNVVHGERITAELVSIDGETKSGQKRYTLRITYK